MTLVRTLETSVHGRYLVEPPRRSQPTGILVGFHGYAESADVQLERLRTIPGADAWLLASVQGLNRFYRGRTEDVVASWMTRQDRDQAIADTKAFVHAVIDAIAADVSEPARLVLAGFSQGVATTFRVACSLTRRVSGVIALGGDVPPELDREALARVTRALVGRGERDTWYGLSTWTSDVNRLREAGVAARECALDAAHEWTDAFSAAAGTFLAEL